MLTQLALQSSSLALLGAKFFPHLATLSIHRSEIPMSLKVYDQKVCSGLSCGRWTENVQVPTPTNIPSLNLTSEEAKTKRIRVARFPSLFMTEGNLHLWGPGPAENEWLKSNLNFEMIAFFTYVNLFRQPTFVHSSIVLFLSVKL